MDSLTESGSIRQDLKKNYFAVCSFVVLESISKLFKHQQDQLEKYFSQLASNNFSGGESSQQTGTKSEFSLFRSIELNSLLNDYFALVIEMLKSVCRADSSNSSSSSDRKLTVVNFNRNENHSDSDLFDLINNSLKSVKTSFFLTLFNSFRYQL